MKQLLPLFFVVFPYLLTAQLSWIVPPVIEDTVFFYLPESAGDIVILGKKPTPQRLQRTDGSYLFGGQAFQYLQSTGASGIWSGRNLDDEPVVFNGQEVMLSDGYDELNNYYRTNILMTKKNDLFGLITSEGKVVRKPKFKNLRRKQQGLYLGEYPDGKLEEIIVSETDGLTDQQRASTLRIHSSQLKDRIMVREKSGKRNYPYWGMTDMEGNEVLPANRYYSNYNKMHFEQQVMVAIDSKNDKEGVLDKDGKVLVPFIYDKVSPYLVNGQYVVAEQADTTYLLDFNGQVKASTIGKKVFRAGSLPLVKEVKGKQYRLLNLDFQPVLPDTFSYISGLFDEGGFMMLKQGKKTRFFTTRTGVLSSRGFNKVNGSFALPPLAVRENKTFGLYDVYNDRYIIPPTYKSLYRNGDYFRSVYVERDTVRVTEDSMTVTATNIYQIFREDGTSLLGPTANSLTQVSGDIWQEIITKDSLVLHDVAVGKSKPLSKKQGKLINEIIAFEDGSYTFTADYLSGTQPLRYEFLDRKYKDHALRRYQRSGKFGLMRGSDIITEPIYDEIDLSFIRYGIKARVGDKWGVLALPEGL